MVGIREAQVEYPKPEVKKNIALAILYCFGVLPVNCSLTEI